MDNVVDREALIKFIESEIKENRFDIDSLLILLRNGAFSVIKTNNWQSFFDNVKY